MGCAAALLMSLVFPRQSAGADLIDFSGYYSLTPRNGDKFGNWARTGNVSVDTSLAPNGLRLQLEGPSAGSFTIVVPAPMQLNMIFETAIEGEGLITFYGDKRPGFPLSLDGNYVSSSGSLVNRGDIYGFELRAGANSRARVDVLHFKVIPEPCFLSMLALGGCLLVLRFYGD